MNNQEEWIITLKKIPVMIFGLFLYGTGTVATIHASMGVSPWDVFHIGVSNHTPLTLGQVSQTTGLIIILISYFIGIVPGLASVCNMFFIGFFIDVVNNTGIFKIPQTFIGKLILLFFGIIIIGWGSYFYLKVKLGAGPRDALMEGLLRKFDKPVWMIRGAIEITVLIIGYFLGGPVGVGTLITAFTIGFAVQFAFKIGKYDSKTAVHENLVDMFRRLKMSKEEVVEVKKTEV